MGRNVEIKARLGETAWSDVRRRASELADRSGEIIDQKDTFFNVRQGRLKLREFTDGSGELIFYERPDQSGPKTSSYSVSQTSSPGTLRDPLSHALGVRGVIKKRRELLIVGQTRVHLDQVEGLGLFVELEVVLEDTQSEPDGQKIANELMRQLGIDSGDLVPGAYVDLLRRRTGGDASAGGQGSAPGKQF